MLTQQHFKLTRQAVLLATITAAFPATGYCVAAGRADFVIGDVVAIAADGSQRPLAKGSEINSGESINTVAGARAQIRFTDGGFVSLQPNSQFRVDQYQYQGKTDGEEKGFFSLLKGGLRAITGAIGRVNRENYQVATTVATIGIRGTGYNAVLRNDGLFVNVGEGAISLTNNAGILVVTAGGAAFVADFNTPPRPTDKQPQTPPAGLEKPTFTVAEQRDSAGNLTILPVSLVSGPGYTLAYAFLWDTCNDGCFRYGTNLVPGVNAIFSGTSQLLQYDNSGAEGGALGAARVSFSATDGIIGWGRWDGDTAVSPVTNAGWPHPMTNGVFHYVIGIPTAAMPTSGTATYSLLGATTPSATDSSTGWSVTSGSLVADFATSNVGVNLAVANTNHSYAVSGSMDRTGANFYGSPSVSGCAYCYANINGFFAGANASRAGLTYNINDYGLNVQGAAAFKKN